MKKQPETYLEPQMIIADVIRAFEQWANPDWQESWDNCGWQVETGISHEPAGILVCLTPTLAVMHEAIALKAEGFPINLIFAHHPLIFGRLSSVVAGDSVGDMVRLAIAHDIAIYTAHTNFDQVKDGTADVLAQLLELQAVRPVVSTAPDTVLSGDKIRGYGRVGNLPASLSLQQLLEKIHSILAPPHLLYSPSADLQQRIEKLAVLGGSGASYIDSVKKTGAQAYLTADCKFHQFQASRDQNLILIDAGHYATERPACERLVSWFKQQGAAWVQLSEQDEDFRQFF